MHGVLHGRFFTGSQRAELELRAGLIPLVVDDGGGLRLEDDLGMEFLLNLIVRDGEVEDDVGDVARAVVVEFPDVLDL